MDVAICRVIGFLYITVIYNIISTENRHMNMMDNLIVLPNIDCSVKFQSFQPNPHFTFTGTGHPKEAAAGTGMPEIGDPLSLRGGVTTNA